ncbi:serine hydrolase domain-containing protein [Solicola sp. PLA-1-18]|uniref:serine hydrolase domain-containing protein n=1 Tax=Solicola sp. PLA-1-18 TaxID=3380532 RepID=UPI003B779C7D
MSDALLASTARRAEAITAAAQAHGRLPSLASAVVRGGEVVWTDARGAVASEDGALRPGADVQYRIGSISKTFTAVLVMQLVAEGVVDLADAVSTHVADAPLGDATVRGLLSHAAGLPAEPVGSWWERSAGSAWDVLAAGNASAHRVLPVGQQYHYSNLAYGVLGRLVEVHRGAPWSTVLDERVLRPLGLTRTTYAPTAPHADGFGVEDLTGLLVREPHQDTGAMAPAGQLWSTTTDVARWLAFLADPDSVVLDADGVAAMTRAQSVDPDDPRGGSYGLGLRLSGQPPHVLVGHTGSMPGFVCGAFVDPATGVGAVCLSNGGSGLDAEGLPRALVDLVRELEPPLPEPWTPTSHVDDDVRALLGTWYWGQAAAVMRVEGSGLRLASPGGRAFTFERTGPDTWRGTSGYQSGETLRVVRRADGAVSHLDVGTFAYTRTPYDPDVPHPGRGWR